MPVIITHVNDAYIVSDPSRGTILARFVTQIQCIRFALAKGYSVTVQ